MSIVALSVPLLGALLLLISSAELLRAPSPRSPGQGLSTFALATMFAASPLLEAVPLGGTVTQAAFLALTLGTAFITALVLILNRVTVWISGILFSPALIVTVFAVVNAILNPLSNQGTLIGRTILIAFWTAVALLVAAAGLAVRQIGLLVTIQFASACALTLLVAQPYRDCDSFKCGPLGAIFTGPFRSENLLAQLAALTLVFMPVPARRPVRWLAVSTSTLVLLATVSRTSWLAVVAALCIGIAIRTTKPTSQKLRVRLGFGFLLSMIAAGFYILLTAQASDWSNRGRFWRLALDALDGNWAFGRGADGWRRMQDTGGLPGLYPHSQYLLLVFWAGFLGLVLWIALMGAILVATSKDRDISAVATPYVALIATLGVTETFWNPLSLDTRTISLLALLALPLCVAREGKSLTRLAPKGVALMGQQPSSPRLTSRVDIRLMREMPPPRRQHLKGHAD